MEPRMTAGELIEWLNQHVTDLNAEIYIAHPDLDYEFDEMSESETNLTPSRIKYYKGHLREKPHIVIDVC